MRRSLMSAIMLAIHAVNPFSSNREVDVVTVQNPKRNKRKVESQAHYSKPTPKSSFKQNQRKQRKASARKKAK